MTPAIGLETHVDEIAVTVLGVGNLIMGDDGAGLELMSALQERCPDPRVEFVEGATDGMGLLPVIQDANRLLILDAVDGPQPGAVTVITGDHISRLLSTKVSPHQLGLRDVFSAARITGREPSEIVVVGIVPDSVTARYGLSPVVAAALPEAVERALGVLREWLGDDLAVTGA